MDELKSLCDQEASIENFSKFKSGILRLDAQIRKINDKVADFITLQENSMMQIQEQEAQRRHELQSQRLHFDEQIKRIREMMEEFECTTKSLGVARFKAAALEILGKGDEHLKQLRSESEALITFSQESTERLEKLSKDVEHRLSRTVRSLRLDYFKKLINDGCERAEYVSTIAVERVSQVVKWFHWEKLGIAILISMIVSIIIGLFLNDEWPWETHHRVLIERDAGRLLLHAWPHLSKSEQKDIENSNPHS